MRGEALVVVLLVAASGCLAPSSPYGGDLFVLPERMAGDAGTYNVTIVASNGTVVEPERRLGDFRVLPYEALRDQEGELRPTLPVLHVHYTWTVYATPEERGAGFLPWPAIRNLDVERHVEASKTTPRDQSNDDHFFISDYWDAEWSRLTWYEDATPSCLYAHPMFRQNIPASGTISWSRACLVDDGNYTYDVPAGTGNVVHTELVGTTTAVRIDMESGTSVWFAPDHPYPIKHRIPTGRGAAEVVLVEFARGSAPLGDVPSTPNGFAAPIDMASTTRLGPEPGDVDARFPLETAFAIARDDATFPDLRDFTDGHPDWYLASAQYWEGVHTAATVYKRWTFIVTDGDDNLAFNLYQTMPEAYPPEASQSTYERIPLFEDSNYPPRSALLSDAPDATSVYLRWLDYGPENMTELTPHWGFQVWPATTGEGYGFLVRAGVQQDVRTPLGDVTTFHSSLGVGPAGETTALSNLVRESGSRVNP